MTLIARGLAAKAADRRTRATASEASVTGNFSTGNGLTGTVQGSLTGTPDNGVFHGTLATSAGQVEERTYSGPVTSTSAAWAPGPCVQNCTPGGLSGAIQTVLTPPTGTSTPLCTFGLGAGDRSFETDGGNGTVAVTATANCAWSAEALVPWITIVGDAAAIGGGTVAFTVQANTGAERQGSLRVAGQTFAVSQKGHTSVGPAITAQPQSLTIPSGTSTTLSVAASSTLPLTYQWFVGASGVTGNPISGATASSFTTPALTTTTTYWVRVTDSAGRVANSMAATVTVVAEPIPLITVQPRDVTIASGTATTLAVTASSALPLTYQWFVASDGPGNPIPGATASTYTTPALTATTTYRVRVTNSAGFVDSSDVTVTVVVPPVITSQPQGVTIQAGTSTTLAVTASSTVPITYQWYSGPSGVTTNPIPGATASSFTTPALTVTTTYWVRASNSGGFVNSSAATVTVLVTGTIIGRVTSAATGLAIPGATVSVGAISTTTTATGDFTLVNVPAGQQTVSTSALNFTTRSDAVTISGGATASLTISLVPTAPGGAITIVLNWGANPADLDAHLTGPAPGGGRFEVYYGNREPVPYATLDIDDQNGFGPETIRVSTSGGSFVPGTYRYFVDNFEGAPPGFDVSNAIVTVSQGGVQLARFVASAATGSPSATYWSVFTFTLTATSGGQIAITPVQQFTSTAALSTAARVKR